VLFAEDDELIHPAIASFLTDEDFLVDAAWNGAEAVVFLGSAAYATPPGARPRLLQNRVDPRGDFAMTV
jgi:CheY-like chemotaxis protein